MNDAGVRMLIADPRFRETVEKMRADLPTVEKIIWTGDEDGRASGGGRDVRYEELVAGDALRSSARPTSRKTTSPRSTIPAAPPAAPKG